jgi:hypothetical protein
LTVQESSVFYEWVRVCVLAPYTGVPAAATVATVAVDVTASLGALTSRPFRLVYANPAFDAAAAAAAAAAVAAAAAAAEVSGSDTGSGSDNGVSPPPSLPVLTLPPCARLTGAGVFVVNQVSGACTCDVYL